MKMFALAGCMALLLTGICFAQGTVSPQPVTGEMPPITIDYHGNVVPPPAFCANVYNNSARSKWFFPMPKDFMMLDWGYMNPTIPSDTNNLPDEVIEGFSFAYATNDTTPGGMTWALHFYDQCTGWCERTRVEEANFTFQGLPNSANLPAGIYAWTITVDLQHSGYEFLLDEGDQNSTPRDGIGIGLKRLSAVSAGAVAGPAIGMPPGKGALPWGPNHTTQTSDAFCVYYPSGACTTQWFGGYTPGVTPYAGMRNALYGGCDPAVNTKYMGIGQLIGNEASLYVAGTWMIGGNAHFIMRLNQMPEQPSLCATIKTDPKYYGSLDIYKIFPIPIPWRQVMATDPVGDFAHFSFMSMGAKIATKSISFQGLITDKFNGGATTPIDMTRDYVKTN